MQTLKAIKQLEAIQQNPQERVAIQRQYSRPMAPHHPLIPQARWQRQSSGTSGRPSRSGPG